MEDNKIIDAMLADPGTGVQLLLEQYGGLIHAVVRRVLPNDPQDEEYIDTNTNSYAMRSSTVDPTTGIISCRIDYYTADPAQVAKISEFRYLFGGGYHADASRAVTLALE